MARIQAALAGLAAATLAIAGARSLPVPPPPSPNVLLISIDTLRADRMSAYGNPAPTTPRLDALMATGTRFAAAVSASSWTVPGHMSLLTGLEPCATGLTDYPRPGRLDPSVATLAEVLRDRGYQTAAFTGGGYVSPRHGFRAGFDTFASHGRRFEDNLEAWSAWLDRRRPNRPFFAFLHGFNVHKPYRPPPPYDTLFCPDYDGDYDVRTFQPDQPRPTDADLDYVRCQYDGELRYVDDLLADLLADLDARGLLDDTIVVLTSDHGEEFYDHGKVDHIHTLYEELVRVPLALWGPGIRPQVIDVPVGTVDVMPTVLGLLDVPIPPGVQGADRSAWLEGGVPAGVEAPTIYGRTGFSDFPYAVAAVRTPRWKLVEWRVAGMADVDLAALDPRPLYTYKFREDLTEDTVELFDLAADPAEQEDVAAAHPDVVRSMRAALATIEETCGEARRTHADDADDPAYLRALRELGYLQ